MMGRKEAGSQRGISGFNWKQPLTDTAWKRPLIDTTWDLCLVLLDNGLQVSLKSSNWDVLLDLPASSLQFALPPEGFYSILRRPSSSGDDVSAIGFRLPGTNCFVQQAKYLRRCGCHCSRLAGLTGPLHLRALGRTKHWGSRWLSGRTCTSRHQSHLQAARP